MSKDNISRTRRILDVLDSLASTASIADTTSNPGFVASAMLNTQKWLHDISVGRNSGSGPPRTTLRTPSRLYSIVSNARDKPYWKRPTEMAAAAATKKKEVSFEADLEPGEIEQVAAKRISNSEKPKTHQSILKSYTGRNVAGSIKSNTFNANLVDLEADISSEKTKKALESVKPLSEFGPNLTSGFLTKNRVFDFAKPVIRGPQAVLEKSFEKEESSSDESSEEEESDKEVEPISTKAINSDTSSSSPENSKIQKPPTPVTKEPLPLPVTSAPGSWDCQTCMVNNAASEQKCVCCDTPKEGGSGNAAPQPTFKPTQFKPVSSSVSFGFKPANTPASDSNPTNVPATQFKLTNVPTTDFKPAEIPVTDSKPALAPAFGFFPSNTAAADTKSTANGATDLKPAAAPSFGFKPADTPAQLIKFGNVEQPATNGTEKLNGTSNSSNLFNLNLPSTGAAPTFAAPSFHALGQQNTFSTVTNDSKNSTEQAISNPPAAAPFTFNAAPPAATFNFGGTEPAKNGAFHSNGSSSNLFNLPFTGQSSAAPSFPALGQQNAFPIGGGNNSTEQTVSNPTSAPFTFNTAPTSFNFGGSEQPATNGTFQFNGVNGSSSSLFSISGAAPAFSAPSFPALGQQNSFMPPSGGSNMGSNARRLLLAKRTRKK